MSRTSPGGGVGKENQLRGHLWPSLGGKLDVAGLYGKEKSTFWVQDLPKTLPDSWGERSTPPPLLACLTSNSVLRLACPCQSNRQQGMSANVPKVTFSQGVSSRASLLCQAGSPGPQEGSLSQAWAGGWSGSPCSCGPICWASTFPSLDLTVLICKQDGFCSPLDTTLLCLSRGPGGMSTRHNQTRPITPVAPGKRLGRTSSLRFLR